MHVYVYTMECKVIAMKPDPPIDSIVWGKRYSLKDRTPQVVVGLFLIAALMLTFWFSSVNNECHEETIGDNQNFIEKYFQ